MTLYEGLLLGFVIVWPAVFALSMDMRKGHRQIAHALNRIADRLDEKGNAPE